MTQSDLRKIDCWNCGTENSVVYGGDSSDGVEKCDNCEEVVAETGIDSITIPESKQDAIHIEERNKAIHDSSIQNACPHPSDRIIPYSFSTKKVPPSITEATSFADRETVLEKVLCLECDNVMDKKQVRE